MDGFVTCGTNFFRHIGYPYILIYNRKLTENELLDYELDFLKEVEYTE